MTKRQSDFRADRDHNTAPDFDDPYEVKLAYQRELERRRAAAEKPSDLPEVDMNEQRWWCIPFQPSPEQLRQQRRKYERQR
jgi:hypothetical protein